LGSLIARVYSTHGHRRAFVDRLATEMQAVLKEPAVVKRWEEIGATGSTMTPAQVTRFIQGEIDKWTPVVKASGAKPG
jgi:tripartite-type tricarboxylate transporter receptor subunit TctC